MAEKLVTDERRRLRSHAEEVVAHGAKAAAAADQPASVLLHELQVHQVELEMQNEELRRSQIALEEAHASHVDLYDFAPVGYLTLDGAGLVARANLAAASLLGVDRSNLLGLPFAGFVERADADRWHLFLKSLLRGGAQQDCELALRWTDESVFDAHLACQRKVDDGSAPLVRVVLTDITKRRRAEEALLASEERYRSVVTNMTEGVVVRDADGVVTACNPAADRIFGLGGHEWPAIHEDGSPFDPEEHPATAALRSGHSQLNVVMGFQKPGGVLTWVKINSEPLRDPHGRVVGVVSTIADITERRALREQATVSLRLAAMATLVAGVAHEINNPLAGEMSSHAMAIQEVQTLAALLRGGDPVDRERLARGADEVVEMLGDAQIGSKRIARIVKELSAIGRSSPERVPIRLSAVVESAMQWLPGSVGHGVTIRVEAEGAPEVLAAEGQLEQVVTNLVTNGSLAIPAGRQGEITVRIGPGTPGMARLEVEDNGTGIAPDILVRIFDPFFTTRDVGKGMGLGLAICHAIVTAHGGTITVRSTPGKGSTFRVELPVR